MTKRILTIGVGLLLGAFLLGSSYQDYFIHRATGRPFWWFILELLVAATAIASVVLLTQRIHDPRLESITGLRAVAGILSVVLPQIPAIYAGVSLDEYVGFDLAFVSALSFTVLALSIRTAAMLAPESHSLLSDYGTPVVVSTVSDRATPPN